MDLIALIVLLMILGGLWWGMQLAIIELVWHLAPYLLVVLGIILLIFSHFIITGIAALLIGILLIVFRHY